MIDFNFVVNVDQNDGKSRKGKEGLRIQNIIYHLLNMVDLGMCGS